MEGEPLQIMKVSEEGTVELLEDNLKKILQHPDVKDKPVAVVTVAGPFRKGKSFLLNHFVNYLGCQKSGAVSYILVVFFIS